MNYKERGYLFQDIFSTYIIIKYVKQILCGQKVQTEVVLDKKNSKDDKFDDLKIINNDDILEVQLKYKEIKEELEDLDKEKVKKIAEKKVEQLKKKTEELVEYAKEKGTPVLEKAAKDVKKQAANVCREVLKKLENDSE